MIDLKQQPPLTILLMALAILGFLTLMASVLPAFVLVPKAKAIEPLEAAIHLRADQPGQSYYAAIIERPLFNPGRHKDEPPLPAAQAAPLPPLDNYRLVGIVTKPGLSLALIERRESKEVLELKAGDNLDGRKIDDVDTTGVSLSGSVSKEKMVIPKAASTNQNVSQNTTPQPALDSQ